MKKKKEAEERCTYNYYTVHSCYIAYLYTSTYVVHICLIIIFLFISYFFSFFFFYSFFLYSSPSPSVYICTHILPSVLGCVLNGSNLSSVFSIFSLRRRAEEERQAELVRKQEEARQRVIEQERARQEQVKERVMQEQQRKEQERISQEQQRREEEMRKKQAEEQERLRLGM